MIYFFMGLGAVFALAILYACYRFGPQLGSFLKEIFQDVDDGFSAKRTGFFIFTILLAVCVIGSVFLKIAVPTMIWNGLVDLIKWVGAAILGERAPAALAALRPKGTI